MTDLQLILMFIGFLGTTLRLWTINRKLQRIIDTLEKKNETNTKRQAHQT